MVARTVTVRNQLGLHARAAARFVHLASRYRSRIRVGRGARVMDGKSILGVLLLAASRGTDVTISADGSKIAYVSGSTLVVIGANGGGSQSIAPSSQHESASFSPNSTRLAYAHDNAITIRSLTTGQSFTKTAQGRVREPAWSNNRK